MSVYLGLDASTQSLTAVLICCEGASPPPRPPDALTRGAPTPHSAPAAHSHGSFAPLMGDRRIVAEVSLNYDAELPQYRTDHGVLRGEDPAVVSAPPLMWVEALEAMMARLCREFPDEMKMLAAVSGSAQQHGSVYVNDRWMRALASAHPAKPLVSQLREVFARTLAPVWMDSSTTEECAEIERAIGGPGVLARHTGSRAFERFTGPQIRACYKRDARAYDATARVHLVSSFHASLLAGEDAPIDVGDGSGMNLMEVASRAWWTPAVEATAPDLARRLPHVQPSWAIAGQLSSYWRTRFGLPGALVVAWSGDNPCSLIGSGLVREGQLGVSLGTSDTVCGMMRALRIHDAGIGYVSASPTGEFMGTTVFKNGSLARERIRDQYGYDWAAFSAALRSTPPGNGGAIMLPWFDPEITPHVITPGVRRVGLDVSNGPANVRAIIEAQMMAMANHTRWMGADTSVIFATGGASANSDVLQVMANVFDAEVVRARAGNAAALGAALRAWHADGQASGRPMTWDEIVAGFTDPDPAWRVHPQQDAVAIYKSLRTRYAEAESKATAKS
jgi:xylulokinase